MASCEICKYFGKKGFKDKETVPFCFKKEVEVEGKNKPCSDYATKYCFKTFRKKHKHRHHRRASGGMM